MLPHNVFHTHLWTLAHTSYLLVANPGTPELLRRELLRMIRRIKKKLPPEAILEVFAVEAEAAIKATDCLRDHLRRSSSDT